MKFHIEGVKHFLVVGKDKRSGEIKYTFYKVEDGPRERSKPNFEELIAQAGTNTDLPPLSQANNKPTEVDCSIGKYFDILVYLARLNNR